MKKIVRTGVLVLGLALGIQALPGLPCQEVEAATYLTTTESGDWYMDETSAVALQRDKDGHAFAVIIYCGDVSETVYYYAPATEKIGYFYYKSDKTNQQWIRTWMRANVPEAKAFASAWYRAFGYSYS